MARFFLVRSRLSALTLTIALVAGCVTTGTPDGINILDPGRDFTRVWRDYPDMDQRYSRPGRAVTLAQMRQVARGQDKAALLRNLGQPAFQHEDGSMEFHLALTAGPRDRLVCQYRVYFDAEDRVWSSVWRRAQCAELVAGAARA